jgi:3-oxoacyl-[acyl-carrier-protein] synthase-3
MMTAPRPQAAPEGRTRTGLRAGILGIGSHCPEGLLTNADLMQMVETSDTWIMERTGIRTRHRVGAGETASQMGAAAARRALASAGSPDIDTIVAATCTPDTLLPSTACLIHRQLGMEPLPAFDLNAVCSGFVYGLTVADALVRTRASSSLLLVATEAMTQIVDYHDRSTCVLFGDAAAAVIMGPVEDGGIAATRWSSDGGEADLIYYGPAAAAPEGPDGIRMAGKGTYRLAVDRLCSTAEELCADAGWRLDEVQHFIPHQANLRIIEAASKRLGVSQDRVFTNVEERGNTSAASIPLAMSDAFDQGRLHPGDKIISVAFGAGATWGGVALEWTLPCSS